MESELSKNLGEADFLEVSWLVLTKIATNISNGLLENLTLGALGF